MPPRGGRAGRGSAGRVTRAQEQEETEQNRTDVPRRQINISGVELPYVDPNAAAASQRSNSHTARGRKVPGTAFDIRVAASKNEIWSKINAYLHGVAPDNTHVQDVSITVKLSGANHAYSRPCLVKTDGQWDLLLETLKAQPKKGVQIIAEWMEARPPTPPPAAAPTPTPAAPTAAASNAASRAASPRAASPPPAYSASSSTGGNARQRRRRNEAREMDERRHAELDEDMENQIAIYAVHKRCDLCARTHADDTHCYLEGNNHYPLKPTIVAQWARMVSNGQGSVIAPPPPIMQLLLDARARARGPIVGNYLASLSDGPSTSSGALATTSSAATSHSDNTAASAATPAPQPLGSSEPNQQGNSYFWSVWGLDKRTGLQNKDLVVTLFEKKAKTMPVLARARRQGIVEKEFGLSSMDLVIIDEWIEEWRSLDEEESAEERQISLAEVLAAAKGE